ncbi:hypothetical protein [Microbacterium radiodurans]|uniref:Uncharacterized protein n=1 Tax=Microbacterium radiodurans TaxID=661398 RepID=A0A5J5IW40_9MICO|nr:hypothetical protein [Microbacterium radiodurans]KAA9089042.1 hypothetical protein F6B42_00600 [Microbacterium radiodurans]
MARMTGHGARELAQTSSQWDAVSWWRLEARALRDHPDVQLALGRLAPREAWRDLVPSRPAFVQPLLAIAQIASIVLPAVAAFGSVRAVLIEGDQLDLGVAGTAMGVAAVIALSGILSQRRRPESAHPRTARMLGIIHLVSALAVLVMAAMAFADDRVTGVWGIAGVLADLAIGVFFVVRYRRVPEDENRDNVERAARGLKRRIDRLSPGDAAAILVEIGAAVDTLAERGLIDAAAATRARRAPLGLLAVTMTQSGQ